MRITAADHLTARSVRPAKSKVKLRKTRRSSKHCTRHLKFEPSVLPLRRWEQKKIHSLTQHESLPVPYSGFQLRRTGLPSSSVQPIHYRIPTHTATIRLYPSDPIQWIAVNYTTIFQRHQRRQRLHPQPINPPTTIHANPPPHSLEPRPPPENLLALPPSAIQN